MDNKPISLAALAEFARQIGMESQFGYMPGTNPHWMPQMYQHLQPPGVRTNTPETLPLPQPQYATEEQLRRWWGNDPSNPFPAHVFRK